MTMRERERERVMVEIGPFARGFNYYYFPSRIRAHKMRHFSDANGHIFLRNGVTACETQSRVFLCKAGHIMMECKR